MLDYGTDSSPEHHSSEAAVDISDEIRSHIVAEAGEDANISLQHILLEEQGKDRGHIAAIDDSSMMDSVAERTDNIINYSGALNTSEEFIENGVNVSGTLGGPINPYSIVSSATKPGLVVKPATAQAAQQQLLQ